MTINDANTMLYAADNLGFIFIYNVDGYALSQKEEEPPECKLIKTVLFGWFMVFNATFNTISVISWQSVLMVEEIWRKPPTFCKSLTNFIT